MWEKGAMIYNVYIVIIIFFPTIIVIFTVYEITFSRHKSIF